MEKFSARNVGFDLVRVTEAAALSAGRWMGLGDRDRADGAAIEAMHKALSALDIEGYIVIGEEGKLSTHSLLDSGQKVGTGQGPAMDLVLDPIDGRNLLAQGASGAISVAAMAPRGAIKPLAPAVYLDKLVVDRGAAAALVPECLDAPAAWVLALVARVKKKQVRDLVVFVLDRPRHRALIDEIRAAGARVTLRSDGDIAGALLAATPHSGVDLLMGIGGAAEGVIAACAVRAVGGAMLARIAPQSANERALLETSALDARHIFTGEELVAGEEIFFAATGITDGRLLHGVQYHDTLAETQSLVLRCETRTRRVIYAEHLIEP
jgi:fructose-1,6-bisphosphatase II